MDYNPKHGDSSTKVWCQGRSSLGADFQSGQGEIKVLALDMANLDLIPGATKGSPITARCASIHPIWEPEQLSNG